MKLNFLSREIILHTKDERRNKFITRNRLTKIIFVSFSKIKSEHIREMIEIKDNKKSNIKAADPVACSLKRLIRIASVIKENRKIEITFPVLSSNALSIRF